MKKLSLVVALVMISAISFAQVPESYKKGQMSATAGLGLASVLGGTPLFLAAEYGWADQYGIGANLTYQKYTTGYYDVSWFYLGVGAIYHYDLLKMSNVDTYGRFGLGFALASASYNGPAGWEAFYSEPTVGGFGYDAAVGGTYYATSNIGINAELGYGLALLKVGITYKM